MAKAIRRKDLSDLHRGNPQCLEEEG